MRVTWNLVGVVVLFALAMPAEASVITIDNGAASGYSETGSWYGPYGTACVGDGGYLAANSGTATAVYTPGGVSGFSPGLYDVYASWGVYPSHGDVAYTVNYSGGSSVFTIQESQNAAQGASGSLPSGSSVGSGFRRLGTFSLDASSNVVLSGGGPSTVPITADAIMVRSAADGQFIDQQSANLTSGPATWEMAATTTSPSGSYSYTAGVTATWAGIPATGSYDLQVSWGVHAAHSTDMKYLVDVNGNGVQDPSEQLFTINQSKMADQLTGGDGVWSGYYDLGDFSLTSSSKVVQWNEGSGAMTVAPMVVTSVPEPTTLVLLANAVLGLLAYAWSKRK